MGTTTTNYSFGLPTIDGDADSWGTQLNANWTKTDGLLSGSQDLSTLSVTTSVTLKGQGDLILADADSSHSVSLQAAATIGTSYTLTLPAADGSNGQVLATDGSGNLSFTTISGFDGAFSSLSGTPTTIAGYGITDAFDGAYGSLTGAPTIPSNVSDLTNDSGFITSADGGNAATLDGIDSSSFLRSDASDTMTGVLTVDNHLLVANSSAVTGQGDNNTHWNYQNGGTNYIRGTLTYVNSPLRIGSTGGIQRSAHNNGYLEGGYNNIGANSTHTSPIYIIGSNYQPTTTALSNMYGIGYSHHNATFISQTMGWGMYVAADGDARIMLSGSYGHGFFTGNVTAYASDERLKTNVKPVENALEKVCRLRGVEFDWVDNITSEYDFHPTTMHETGVLAQNVAEVIPDAVREAPFNGNYTQKCGTDHEFLTVDKEKIIPVLIEAIKELKAEVEELKAGCCHGSTV